VGDHFPPTSLSYSLRIATRREYSAWAESICSCRRLMRFATVRARLSTFAISLSIIVFRSFSRSCAGVRISRLPRGPPLRVLEAVGFVPLVVFVAMRAVYPIPPPVCACWCDSDEEISDCCKCWYGKGLRTVRGMGVRQRVWG